MNNPPSVVLRKKLWIRWSILISTDLNGRKLPELRRELQAIVDRLSSFLAIAGKLSHA